MSHKDPSKRAARDKKYRENNKEKINAYQKEYNQTLEGKYKVYKASAKRREIPFNISLEYFRTYWQQPCEYCGDPIDTIGLDRINSSLGYQENNLRSCCTFCNVAKNDNTEAYFKDKITKLYKRMMEE